MTIGARVRHVERGWFGSIAFVGEIRHLITWDNGKESWCDSSWLVIIPPQKDRI